MCDRAADLTAFYTDDGVLSRSALVRMIPDVWSVHLLGGTALIQGLIFAVHAAAAVCIISGWRLRSSLCVAWLLTVSVQERNPWVLLGGADVYLRMLLFWSLFVPWDQVREGRKSVNGWACAALLLQIATVYGMTGYFKSFGPSWQDGTAVELVIRQEYHARPLAYWLQHAPHLTRVLTSAVLYLEIAAPLLIFFPLRTAAARSAVAASLAVLHLGILACLHIDSFQMISLTALMLLIPSGVWDRLGIALGPHVSAQREAGPRWGGSLREAAAACLLFLSLFLNLGEVRAFRSLIPDTVRSLGRRVHIDQSWRMFHEPARSSCWFLAVGTYDTGLQKEFLAGMGENWRRKPGSICKTIGRERWRKLLFRLESEPATRMGVAQYLCYRETGKTPGDRLRSVRILKMTRPISPGEQSSARYTFEDYDQRILIEQSCGARTKAGIRRKKELIL